MEGGGWLQPLYCLYVMTAKVMLQVQCNLVCSNRLQVNLLQHGVMIKQ